MGYDLIMVREPYNVPDDLPELLKESPGYFRGVPHEAMEAAGIFGCGERESFKPTVHPPAGMTKARWEEIFFLFDRPADDDPPTSVRKTKPTFRELRVMQNYVDESYRDMSVKCKKPGKVPSSKFAGNNGCHVTSEECLAIASRLYKYLERAKDVEDREFVEAFAAFNELAAKYDGYEVW
jgi:hypothetical protein